VLLLFALLFREEPRQDAAPAVERMSA
jgi:hypothetical protein